MKRTPFCRTNLTQKIPSLSPYRMDNLVSLLIPHSLFLHFLQAVSSRIRSYSSSGSIGWIPNLFLDLEYNWLHSKLSALETKDIVNFVLGLFPFLLLLLWSWFALVAVSIIRRAYVSPPTIVRFPRDGFFSLLHDLGRHDCNTVVGQLWHFFFNIRNRLFFLCYRLDCWRLNTFSIVILLPRQRVNKRPTKSVDATCLNVAWSERRTSCSSRAIVRNRAAIARKVRSS